MTGIFATIANIARDKAAAASQQAENDPSLSAEDVIDLKAYAAMLEALATLADGGNYHAIKWICGKFGLTAEWNAYLEETGRDPYLPKHQLPVQAENDDYGISL
ncbi:hypothetical protein RAH32_18835 [Paracoccus sp. WLY502]|uniref:hypothetical protein n=1 Tax=Paracoccus yibinensis TaxID=3068891 RepID=UPI00279679FE|nr:hypothetical protein [Paracoccus sp. WLY502]MDQ1902481.1 hypothetical protein [Paracoccus sp. WLY502]